MRGRRLLGGLSRLYGSFDGAQAVINGAEIRPHVSKIRPHVSEVFAYVGAQIAHVGADAADLHAQHNRDGNDGPENPLSIAARHIRAYHTLSRSRCAAQTASGGPS